MRHVLLLVLIAAARAQTIEFHVIDPDLLQQRLRMAHPKNSERYARLKTLFEQTGCTGDLYREQKVSGSKQPNLVCRVPGNQESSRRIVVGAHFDSIGGDGIVDNWSGAVLLPSLAEFMRKTPRRHNFEFVAFAGEEQGLLGSKTYVSAIPKTERPQIAAAITMDSLGLAATKFWPDGSTRELVIDAAAMAQALHLSFQGVNVGSVATTDSESFQKARIPVLSLHSVTRETFGLINNSSDVWKVVSWQDYYDTHKLISGLLVYLDAKLP
jgi:putative aminopeptidase FrvX